MLSGREDFCVIPPTPRGILQKEVDGLPAEQKLTQSGQLDVRFASYDQIPCLMQEIGRLREVTFRAAGGRQRQIVGLGSIR